MNGWSLSLTWELPIELERRINEVCDHFEAACKENARPTIEAPNLVHSVAKELRETLDRLFPEPINEDEPETSVLQHIPNEEANRYVVQAQKEGYFQAVDKESLLQLAESEDVTIYVRCRPGAFLFETAELVQVWPEQNVNEQFCAALRRAFIVGNARSPRQDPECPINELVEIAVRALSPGINDPFTAWTCLDYLSAAVVQFVGRKGPSPVLRDREGNVRVLMELISFSTVLDTAFSLILHYGRSNAFVLKRWVKACERIALHLRSPGHQSDLKELVTRA